MTAGVLDVTDEVSSELFGGSRVVLAERRGNVTLILRRLEEPKWLANWKRVNGRWYRIPVRCSWEIEDREHRSACVDVHSVQGNDYTYWRTGEVAEVVKGGKGLFEVFRLFP